MYTYVYIYIYIYVHWCTLCVCMSTFQIYIVYCICVYYMVATESSAYPYMVVLRQNKTHDVQHQIERYYAQRIGVHGKIETGKKTFFLMGKSWKICSFRWKKIREKSIAIHGMAPQPWPTATTAWPDPVTDLGSSWRPDVPKRWSQCWSDYWTPWIRWIRWIQAIGASRNSKTEKLF